MNLTEIFEMMEKRKMMEEKANKAPKYETIRDKYKRLEKLAGFEIGDKVKVVGSAVTSQFGWSNSWDEGMDEHNGKTYTVLSISPAGHGIKLDFCHSRYSFPFFCLELVEKTEKGSEKKEDKEEKKVDLSDFEAMFGGPAKV